jgi:hypothetical protein
VRKGILIGTVMVAMLALYALSRKDPMERPCRKLIEACHASGFTRGRSIQDRRSFYEFCLKPLMETGTIGEVQVDPSEAMACKQKFARRQRGGNA